MSLRERPATPIASNGGAEASIAGSGLAPLLRAWRERALLTQQQLAERSGLSVRTIRRAESGLGRRPHGTSLRLLADALGLSQRERRLLGGAARGRPPEPRAGIPPDPFAHFAGREPELAELRQLLQRSGRAAIHGLGGVGKTQLALRYLRQRRADYPDGAFWLRTDRETSLVGDLASLAWHLDLPEREEPELERQVDAVLRWLRLHPRWLLVLDNLQPTAADTARRWLPPGLPGHLLVTSRTPMWPARLNLEPLPFDVARRFLLERTGQADHEAAGAVAEALGRLPLALEQAAAYVVITGRDLAGYAELLRTRLIELMGEGRPEDYPRPVATTWELSFERLEGESRPAAALLNLCAFLDPGDIPVSLLRAGAGELPRELRGALADDVELDRAVAALRRYSLVERHGDAMRVHRLVQAVVRESLDADQREAWLAAAVRVLRAGLPDRVEAPASWRLCSRLLAHAQVVDQIVAGGDVEPRALSELLDRIATYLRVRGQYVLARHHFERALAIRERALGSDHPDTAESLNNLAILHRVSGDLAAVGPLHARALAIRERMLGPDHPRTAESLNNLANLFRDQGDLHGARSLYERALAIQERVLGPEHPDTAASLNNLASLLHRRGELSAARLLHERALAIRRRVLGPDHPDTAGSLHNLAHLLHSQGELEAAELLFGRAQDIFERILGPEHAVTVRTSTLLARVLRDRGKLAPARTLSEHAVASLEQALGPEHRWTVEGRRVLEEILSELDRADGDRS